MRKGAVSETTGLVEPSPPTCIYHGTKHFFREGVGLDLHVFRCNSQLTVVPFHKQNHEEFAPIYLDLKAVEAAVVKPKEDDGRQSRGDSSA